jgi:hypothetical protein
LRQGYRQPGLAHRGGADDVEDGCGDGGHYRCKELGGFRGHRL